MTLFTTTEDVSGLLPADYGPLIVQPVEQESIALQVSTVVGTSNHTYRQPIITEDANAAWYSEGAEIAPDDPTFDELETTPAKVSGIVPISNELADDSTPDAATAVGFSLARGIAFQVDRAFFGNLAAPAPKGLESLTTMSEIAAGAGWSDTDAFAAAIMASDLVGGKLSNFVANPGDFLSLMGLKKQDGSNEPLFGSDATAPTRRLILGVPLLSSPHVEPGTIWGIDKRYSTAVLRRDVTLETSREVYFTSDRTAVKATMRIGFGFPHPKSIVKITLGA